MERTTERQCPSHHVAREEPVASLLHDALSRKRISKSELDTHLCIVVVKALATLTNAMLCFLPVTPFIVDLVTGRPNSILCWVRCQSRTRTPP